RQRLMGFAPPKAALTMLPGSEQPFTPDMLAKIAALNPDEIVQSVRDSQGVLQRQFPDATRDANIGEENYALLKRSCQFLKAAAARGLTPAEIYDALARDHEAIFNRATPEDGLDDVFANAIQVARDRSAERQRVHEL